MVEYKDISHIVERIDGLIAKHKETSLLFELASQCKNSNVLGLGSRHGLSSICLGFGAANSGGNVFCVDYWGNEDGLISWVKNVRDSGLRNIFPIVGNANHVLKNIEVNNLGLIFIDTSHSYEDCKIQFELSTRNAPGGCVVAFHDYNHPNYPGVKQYCDELTDAGLLAETQLVGCVYYGKLPVKGSAPTR